MEPEAWTALKWYPFSAIPPWPRGAPMPFWASIHAVGAAKWGVRLGVPRATFRRRRPEAHPAPLEVETIFRRRFAPPKLNPFM